MLSRPWPLSEVPRRGLSFFSQVQQSAHIGRKASAEGVLGTTRDNSEGKPVTQLEYSSYPPLALRTMLAIGQAMGLKHKLTAISIVHRLGVVPIGEESILVAVSAPHREAAWRGGEEALEECKEKVEVWKLEEFGGNEGGVWRANRDGAIGAPLQTQNLTEE